MNETVNIDFIGAIALNEAGVIEYRRIPIPKLFDEEMQKLKAMSDNDNRTIMDLQDYFQSFMPKSPFPSCYDYCAPYSYTSSFINGAKYPSLLSFNEYQTKIKEIEERETLNFLSSIKAKNISDLSINLKKALSSKVYEVKNSCNKNLKKKFCDAANRYMEAHRYYTELRKIKTDPRIKMYSTENIGWSTFRYQISDDILFFMKSNFGYGNSSYHFLNLTYKGIDILPYSALVKYYSVNMVEFYRYTRQYIPTHKNWEVALDFIVDTANLALQDETAFITKWISNEIDEMVAGLKIISDNPQKRLSEFFKNKQLSSNLLYVRNATNSDEEDFLAYPNELSAIFKAEKLSGALNLIEKLKSLDPAYPKVLEAIEIIKALNIDFFPNLNSYVKDLKKEIKRRQDLLNQKIKVIDSLKAKGKPHYAKIEALYEAARKVGKYNYTKIFTDYILSHPNFKVLDNDIKSRSEEIHKEQHQINMREGFVNRLEFCVAQVSEILGLVA